MRGRTTVFFTNPRAMGSNKRLCISGAARNFHTEVNPLLFHATPKLMGEPMKRKKKADPSMLIAKENKKIKKIEKEMRKIQKFGRKLKPVEEIIGKVSIRRNAEKLKRVNEPLTHDESEYRALLFKQWHKYKTRQHFEDLSALSTAMTAQERALQSLRTESEDLYQKAIQINEGDIIFKFNGPTETPPVDDFDSPDGQYVDTTKQY